MSKEKTYEITESRIKAMAEQCPEVERALKKGFPGAFEKEEEWEDVTDKIRIGLCTNNTLNFYHENALLLTSEAYLCRTFYGSIKLYGWDMDKNGYRFECFKEGFRLLKRK